MFLHVWASSLKDALGVDFGSQNASKIDPKSVRNPIKNEVENSCNLGVHFMSILPPTRRQLGPELEPKIYRKSILRGLELDLTLREAKMTPQTSKIVQNMTSTPSKSNAEMI